MKKSEGLYLIRDESEGLGTGEGRGRVAKPLGKGNDRP